MNKLMVIIIAVLTFPVFAAEQTSFINDPASWYRLSLSAETGFLFVPKHTIQFGSAGTVFDYVSEGRQDILFPFMRFTAGMDLFNNHTFILLIQPLEIETTAVLKRDITEYGVTFLSNTPMKLKYGFTFYRASYLFYFIRDKRAELGAGISMQIRNASISFASASGLSQMIVQNIGPVPILKVAGKYSFDNGFWFGGEADGFYASSAIFNGANFAFVGAIWDVSLRAGLKLTPGLDPFLNIRYLGGGANGTEKNPKVGDGFTDNWLHTVSVSIGCAIR